MATALQATLRNLLGPGFQPAQAPLQGTASPGDEAELAAILAAAARNQVRVVPRGSASSPYAAAAAEAGLVVRFERLNRIYELDSARQLVTLEPGVLWQDLIQHLAAADLAPRVYPSSRAFSTVGGFTAQGGAGIGSFEFGPIDRTVERLRLLDSSGQALEVAGQDLELAVGAEGRTGLVSRVTLRVQPRRPISAIIGSFATSQALEACIGACSDVAPLPWSVSFIDPRASAAHDDIGGPRTPRLPPDRYAVLLLCPEERSVRDNGPAEAVAAAGGELVTESASVDHWLDRFMGLQVLRTTPIPLQFRLPEGALSEVLQRITPEDRAGLGFEGVAVDGGQEVVVRFLFTRREMSPARNLDLVPKLLEAVTAARGSPYATGAFFPHLAELTFGAGRLERLRAFARRQDPSGLLNPGRGF